MLRVTHFYYCEVKDVAHMRFSHHGNIFVCLAVTSILIIIMKQQISATKGRLFCLQNVCKFIPMYIHIVAVFGKMQL